MPRKEFSEIEQKEFELWVQQGRERILNQMLEVWKKNTHTMPTPHGRVPYSQPRIKEVKLNKPIGIGVIITEEQIDFDTRGNPQMQQKALVFKWEDGTSWMAHEEHAYTTAGSANIDVVSISAKEVLLGTQSGQKTVSLQAS